MKIIVGVAEVPVIYTAHHASHDYGQFEERVALTTEQKIRFSDYGTDTTVPLNGIATLISERSRALGDLNRDPVDPDRFQEQDYGKPERHDVWKAGQSLKDEDKEYCQKNYYEPFHDKIISLLTKRSDLTFVVAWDNTAHYEIGNDSSGKPVMMKPFILSNRGREESAEANKEEPTSCDPIFLKLLANHFATELEKQGLPSEIQLNFVMRGGHICRRYSTRRNKHHLRALGVNCDVQSLQLEYDTSITNDQQTLEAKPKKMEALRDSFSKAIERAHNAYTKKAE